jgi:hypothetical protein
VTYVILGVVKTAIYVPDSKAERFDRVARQAGLNRSEFYCTAAERLADELEGKNLTAHMDAFLDAHPQMDDGWAAAAGQRLGELSEW